MAESRSEPSKAEHTRGRLLAAAMTAFAEHGFHGTTTRDIAAAAGMSPAAVYVHYRSKEELLFELSRGGHQQVLDMVRAAADESGPPPLRLARLMRTFATHHAQDPTGPRIVNYELSSLTPEHRTEVRTLRRQITEAIRAVIDDGDSTGTFHLEAGPGVDAPAAITTVLLSMGIDISRWYSASGALSPEQIGTLYAQLALRMVGVDEKAIRDTLSETGNILEPPNV